MRLFIIRSSLTLSFIILFVVGSLLALRFGIPEYIIRSFWIANVAMTAANYIMERRP